MNILSFLSFTLFILFVLLGVYCLKLNKHQTLNQFAFYECIILSIWAFAYTFFYTAPSPEEAMFWHRIGCIGGSLFPPFSVYFFLVLSRREHLLSRLWLQLLFYGVPIVILIKNLISTTTCLATGFIQSTSGLGWTYLNSITNLWTWIYVLYLCVYFWIGFYLMLQWRKESSYQVQKRQVMAIIVIDVIVLSFGVTTDIVLPLITPFLPPMANLGTFLFAVGFFYLVSQYQLFTFSALASSDIILDTVMDPVLLLDEKGKILRYNLATCTTLNYNATELLGKDLNILLRSQKYTRDNLDLLRSNKRIESREIDLITADSQTIHAILSATVASDSIDGFMGIVVTFHDITLRKVTELELRESRENYKRLAEELYQLANYDALTQLPNRRMFFSRLKELCLHYHTINDDFAVIFLDLNEFKSINDNYGHDIGDQVLIAAANHLVAQKAEAEIISRMGGDEFTIILPNVRSDSEVAAKIRTIKSLFAEPLFINQQHLEVTVSAGSAFYSQSGFNPDHLIRQADQMMYLDKRTSHH